MVQTKKKTTTKKIKKIQTKETKLKTPVYNRDGKIVSNLELPENTFGEKPNQALINQAVRIYLDRQKKNTASSKTRGEVAGGGRKPWRQKGTGRARAGTIRAPQWRGGGVVFGPQPTESSLKLPKKMRKKALSVALSGKFSESALVIVDKLNFKEPKTKKAIEIINKIPLKDKRKILLILEGEGKEVLDSFRNLENINTTRALDLNTLDVLKSSGLIFTLSSMDKLRSRFSDGSEQSN